ncbi:phenylalanine--tRNA ligase subunit alpha [Candidatus Gracilibacteria bacterium]|nr:MAG: phenylalanine--tRNA ligase subunit alpha [Candidatus Gracilibacteria bacterium]PIE85728.1 MAG: phenylalanine--tRNA ligase subunit alpha [Candidatus Gracilibacteria bacterium]
MSKEKYILLNFAGFIYLFIYYLLANSSESQLTSNKKIRMKKNLIKIEKDFLEKLKSINNEIELKELENKYIGKNGELKKILKGIKDLSVEEKKLIGLEANKIKNKIEEKIKEKIIYLEKLKYKILEEKEKIDVTLEFPIKNKGHKHPISITSEILEDIFISLGFKIEDGPQIETEEINFDKLNIPAEHPARDVWDTFWISDNINKKRNNQEKVLLRTHTSPVQVRTMLKGDLPIKIIVPGRVFRYEQEDARHTSNFYQLEGLMVGKGVTFGDLKWTLETVMKKLLGEKTILRFRPSIFPFTEPSAEIDISCQICKQKNKECKMCSGTGWVELLGAGMVHPKVLKYCGIDPKIYSGFAFGMGIDRIAAQRFGVKSSRMFYQSKLKLNNQF